MRDFVFLKINSGSPSISGFQILAPPCFALTFTFVCRADAKRKEGIITQCLILERTQAPLE